MKIGIHNGAFSYLGTIKEQYTRIKALGYDTVDHDLSDTGMPCYQNDQAMADHCSLIRSFADETGLEIYQVHGPWPTDDTTAEKRTQTLLAMRRSIYGCHILGCRHLVIHPQMPFGWDHEDDPEFSKSLTIELIQNLLPDCERYGIILCLENMPMKAHRISPMKRIVETVAEIDSPYLGICFDTGHSNVFGHDLGDVVRLCAPYLKVLHIHDNDGNRDYHWLPYLGTANWDSFCQALAKTNYNGPLSFETRGAVSAKMPFPLREKAEEVTAMTAKTLAEMVEQNRNS